MKNLILNSVLVALSIVILTILYEFVFESWIHPDDIKTNEIHIEIIVTSLIFALLALLYPTLISIKYQRFDKQLRKELQKSLDEIKQLKGYLPICANCNKIKDSDGHWQHLENYLESHSDAHLTHGICSECRSKLYPELDFDK